MKLEYLLIKKCADEFFQTKEQFKSWLQSNSRIVIEQDTLVFGRTRFSLDLSKWEVEQAPRETVFHLVVSSESDDDEMAKKLDELDTFLARINETSGRQFVVNTIWDDVSAYYERLLYPNMVHIENLLRTIIYQLMIHAVGSSWFDNSVPKDVKESISKTLKKNGKSLDETGEDQLYYADFIQLGRFLFDQYPLKPIGQRAIESIRKAHIEGGMEQVLDAYTAKSNWERYFEKRITVENLEDKWTKLYSYRNQVAHAKRMQRAEYEEANSLVRELTSAFENCLESIGEVKMTKEESRAVQEVARETISPSRTVIRDTSTGRVLSSLPSVYSVADSLSTAGFKLTSPTIGLGATMPRPVVSGVENAARLLALPDRLVVEPSSSAFDLCTTLGTSDLYTVPSMLHRPTSAEEIASYASGEGGIASSLS